MNESFDQYCFNQLYAKFWLDASARATKISVSRAFADSVKQRLVYTKSAPA